MTILGDYWIIIHARTGHWLPELVKPLRGGYTHTEPCRNHSPRLFTTERGAKNALWWWLRGPLTVTVKMADFGDAFSPEPEERWDLTPKPDRTAEDMKVVKVSLVRML